MAYSEHLANRIRFCLVGIGEIQEKKTNERLVFYLNGKTLVGIIENDLVCRISQTYYNEIISMDCCRKPDFMNKQETNIVIVTSSAITYKKQLAFWIDHCLMSHAEAPLSRKRKKKPKLELGSEE